MKNIIKYIIALTLIINVSCDSDNNNDEYGKGYNTGWLEMSGYGDSASFETTINHDEVIKIPVKLNAGTNDNGLKVTYDISLEDGFLDDTSILGERTFMIEKDALNDNIEFTPILSSGFYKLKFTLVSTDDGEFQVGLSDDSQPIDFILNVTNYNNYDAQPTAFGENSPAYVAKIAKIGGTTDQYSVDSAWGPNWVTWATGNPAYEGMFLNAGIITVNTDNTLTITGDYIAGTGSMGTFDSVSGVFDVTFNEADLFNQGFAINTVFTPQQ